MPDRLKDYLDAFDDIPGTRVFTTQLARQGYWVNQFCMSLMKPENRDRWRADEAAYLNDWPMTADQRAARRRRRDRLPARSGRQYLLPREGFLN